MNASKIYIYCDLTLLIFLKLIEILKLKFLKLIFKNLKEKNEIIVYVNFTCIHLPVCIPTKGFSGSSEGKASA